MKKKPAALSLQAEIPFWALSNNLHVEALNYWGHRPLPLCSSTQSWRSRYVVGGVLVATAAVSCRPFLWLFFARPSIPFVCFELRLPARESMAFGAFFLKVQVFQRLLASTATQSHASYTQLSQRERAHGTAPAATVRWQHTVVRARAAMCRPQKQML